jgi:coenzyme F420-reducing hydrogenase delta subunit/ferredoxin
MCSGRVDLVHVLWAFAAGADGVAVTGCHPGDCHYISGNLRARERMDFLEAIFEQLGLRERIEMYYISASEPDGFRDKMTAFTERVGSLGPSPVKGLDLHRHPRKRETLLEVLGALRDRLGVALDTDRSLDEDLVIDGFGHPVYDADKCIGCGACYQSCPNGNIEMELVDGRRTISYRQALCDTCTTCEDVCPVGAVTVAQNRFCLASFLSRTKTPAASLEMKICALCGEPFAPYRQVEHLSEQKALPHPLPAYLELCERCRRARHATEMRAAVLREAGYVARGGTV